MNAHESLRLAQCPCQDDDDRAHTLTLVWRHGGSVELVRVPPERAHRLLERLHSPLIADHPTIWWRAYGPEPGAIGGLSVIALDALAMASIQATTTRVGEPVR